MKRPPLPPDLTERERRITARACLRLLQHNRGAARWTCPVCRSVVPLPPSQHAVGCRALRTAVAHGLPPLP
jgi:hypothetical protein